MGAELFSGAAVGYINREEDQGCRCDRPPVQWLVRCWVGYTVHTVVGLTLDQSAHCILALPSFHFICLSRHSGRVPSPTNAAQHTCPSSKTTRIAAILPSLSSYCASDSQQDTSVTMADSGNAPKPSSSVKLVLLGEAAVGKVGFFPSSPVALCRC